MIAEGRVPTHPGEVLQHEFLTPLAVSQVELAEHIGVPVQRVNEVIKGKRGISSAMAWLLSQAFGTSPRFWTNLQNNYDLAISRPAQLSIPPIRPTPTTLEGF